MTVRIISNLAVAITIGPSLAYGSPACMTESEARAKFPKSHLIWVGTNIAGNSGQCPSIRDPHLRQSTCLPRDPYSRLRPRLLHDPYSWESQCLPLDPK